MVDLTWTRKIRVLLWCTRESYPEGSPQGLAGRSPSSMARSAKHISAHAPRSLEFLMFMPRGFFTRLPSFHSSAVDFVENVLNKKRGQWWPRYFWNIVHSFMLSRGRKVH